MSDANDDFDPDEPFQKVYDSFVDTGQVTAEGAQLVDSGDEPWEAMISQLVKNAEGDPEGAVSDLLLLSRFMATAGNYFPAAYSRFQTACLDTRAMPIFNAYAAGYGADAWTITVGPDGVSISVQVAVKSEEEMRDFLGG
jgi:hypothetical protein